MRQVREGQGGFTLIELLVVILIIGILAAISLPAFLGQTRGASDAKAKSELNTAGKAIESFRAENDTYEATLADLVAFDSTLGNARALAVTGAPMAYVLSAESSQGSVFQVERTVLGVIVRTCAPVGLGGCNDSGGW